MELKFRTLQPNEIECRVARNEQNWAQLLLYKDARVDQRLLDEVVGPMNWKRSHQLIGDRLYCTLSIYNDMTKEWVDKQDVGTESFTEKEKGQASDSFKRAAFNWGIGRELYTAPVIFVNLDSNDFNKQQKIKTRFIVADIGYNDNREVNKLTIVDETGTVRYEYDPVKAEAQAKVQREAAAKKKAEDAKLADRFAESKAYIDGAQTREALKKLHDEDFKDLANYQPFRDALNIKFKTLKS